MERGMYVPILGCLTASMSAVEWIIEREEKYGGGYCRTRGERERVRRRVENVTTSSILVKEIPGGEFRPGALGRVDRQCRPRED
jgi:hypothetical protein